MRILPKMNSWRKGALLYRSIRYRGGFGVHSPFVFNLITKVIEEKCPYYRFYDIELIRKQLLFQEEPIAYLDRRTGKRRLRALGEIVDREAIRPKQGALLFRLANFFKPREILQVGTAMGLSSLYLTDYAKGLHAVALESVPEFAEIARRTFEKGARNPIDLRVGDYQRSLPEVLREMGKVDMAFFNRMYEPLDYDRVFETCKSYAHAGTIFVFEGINGSRRMREAWRSVCAAPEVTVTLDLFSLGIVLFNPKLHKRDYIVYF